ncbi:MAG: HAMP domain-containing sensor histidine kinase [Thermoleophilaceae bacterium]
MTLRPVALRARVALAAAAAILAAVILLGGAVFGLVARELRSSLDETLEARAGEVARLAASTPVLLTAPGALEGRLGGRQLLVQVLDRRGRIVARSLALGGRVLPRAGPADAALRRGAVGYADAGLGEEPLRLYAAPLPVVGDGQAAGGAVLVAGSTAEISGTLLRLRQLVIGSALAAAALAAALAALLVRRALRPLARLSSAARSIAATGDASRRLPDLPARDEVGDLAETLNAMLASLERAREAERRFVGDASHELRTPLTALRGNAAYVARHGADPDVIADLERDAERLSGLLDGLLALAREDAATAPLEEGIRLDQIARTAAGGDPLVELTAPAAVTVRGDRVALQRLVENLLENARRHGPDGGRVRLSVRGGDGQALVEVSDEGPGPAPGEAERAFERFWRAPGARGEGSGLGLAIVRVTAERHGGRAGVEGSRFWIELPTAGAKADVPGPDRALAST